VNSIAVGVRRLLGFRSNNGVLGLVGVEHSGFDEVHGGGCRVVVENRWEYPREISVHDIDPPLNGGRKKINNYLVRTESPVARLVYRLIGLSKVRTATIVVAEDNAWLFLYLHQLMHERTAIAYPTESGMPEKSKQQIQTIVTADMKATLLPTTKSSPSVCC
jgi:hypothetical protein